MTESSSGAGPARGHHWFLDLVDCQCAPELLTDGDTLKRFCLTACDSSGMQVVGEVFHQFEPAGVTGVVLLAESHLSVHTWPELRFAAVDVYVCDFNRQNAGRGGALAELIQRAFHPQWANVRDHARLSVRTRMPVRA
jgi:S-adenosylmethionine decarboxylase